MTALTADRETTFDLDEIRSYPVSAAEIIYLGALVCTNAAGDAIAASDTAGLLFRGVATEHVDNSAGAAGALRVKVRKNGAHQFVAAGLAATNEGDKVFATDDQLVALSTTNDIMVGRLTQFVSATVAMVDISPATKQHGVTDIAAADASDLATAITLVNEIKTTLNL